MQEEKQIKGKNMETLSKVLKIWQSNNSFIRRSINRQESEPGGREHDSMTLSVAGRRVSSKTIVPNSLEDISLTAQQLCEEYIEARLARSGMKEFNNVKREQHEEYSNVLRNMGQILEMKYPRLYTKISVHLRISYDSEIVVWDSFNKFGTNLFGGGITWAKIIAFYAFTGGLALDCMSHGRSYLLARIVHWFGLFVMKRLAAWIQEEGGWKSIINHFNMHIDDDYDSEDEEDDQYAEEDENYKTIAINFIKTRNQLHLCISFLIGGILLSFLVYILTRRYAF